MFRTLLVILFVYSTNGEASLSNDLNEPQPRSLTYLGNVGTKQFFVGDSLVSWQDAWGICYASGLQQVRIKSQAEHSFIIQQLMNENRGPFWLGARDLGNKSMFRWSEYYAPINPDDPDTMIDDYIYYYNYVEQGPLALQMNSAVGTAIFGAHSFGQTGKAFCQSISICEIEFSNCPQ